MAEGGGDEPACQPLPEAGGYDYPYVEEPPENLNCPICFLPCREPHIIECCGAKFCQSCIEREHFAGKPCPLCRVKKFKMLIDQDHKRKILSLKVYCTQREGGCQWIGELRHIENHLDKDCQYVLEACCWDCGRKYARKDVGFHEQDECVNRPRELVLLKKVEALEKQCEAQRKSLEEKDRIIKELKEKMDEDRKEMETKMANVSQQLETKMDKITKELEAKMADGTRELKTAMADTAKEWEAKTANITKELGEKVETKMANNAEGLEAKLANNMKELEKKFAANAEKIEENDNKAIQNNREMEEKFRTEIAAVKEEGKGLQKVVEEVEKKLIKANEETNRETTRQLNVRIEELKQEVEKKLKAELKQLENNKIKPLEEKMTKMDKEVTAAVKTAGDSNVQVQTVQDRMKRNDKTQKETSDRISIIDRQFDAMRKMSSGFKIPEWQRPLPLTSFSNIPPCQFTMMNFTYHKKQGKAWYSPPFYSEPGGYKFCLRIDPNGMLEGKESHLSVWVYVMRGRFDESLKWPFTGKVTVQLLNWKADKGHIQNIVSFDDAAGDKVRARVTSGKYAATGRGSSKFVPHSMLRLNVAKNTEFIVDDCMCFKISKVDVKDISGGYSHTASLSSSDSFSTSTIVS